MTTRRQPPAAARRRVPIEQRLRRWFRIAHRTLDELKQLLVQLLMVLLALQSAAKLLARETADHRNADAAPPAALSSPHRDRPSSP